MLRSIFLVFLLLGLSGCANFFSLNRDLKSIQATVTEVSGNLNSAVCPDCLIVLVVLDKDGQPLSYKVFERPGRFRILASTQARSLFAFHDANQNVAFDGDEPHAWQALPEDLAGGHAVEEVVLDIQPASDTLPPHPYPEGSLFGLRNRLVSGVDIQLGTPADLMEPRFNQEFAEQGMWQPMTFIKSGLAGIYFLEPYSANKTPVLFVHGINGTPRDFSALIQRLDHQQYQPWVFYYPSGLEIPKVGSALLGMLNKLWLENHFKELHIVAHSMGGLVSRSLLGTCRDEQECDFVRTFTSISSPFGGAQAAKSGVDYAPVVMPVWRSMSPGSPFLSDLFATPMPKGVQHHMLFGFRNTSTLSGSSSDGTIPLDSQLRHDAQIQAASVRGFNEDHMSILQSELTAAYVNAVLAGKVSMRR